MSRGLPRITPDWTASGWTLASSHVRGSYRMLTIWAAGAVAAVVISYRGHLYLAAGIATLAILAGAGLYLRLDTQLTPPAAATDPAKVDTHPARQPHRAIPPGPAHAVAAAAPRPVQDRPHRHEREQDEVVLLAAEPRQIGRPR